MADNNNPKPGDPGEEVPPTPPADEPKPNGKETPPAPEPSDAKPKDAPAPAPEPEPEPVSKKKDPEPTPEPAAPGFSKVHLTLVMSLLDRLAELGGDAVPIAAQTKALIKWMAGETTTPPSLELPPSPAKGPSEEEINKRISDEVKKQLDAALKGLPTQRKGLVPPASTADDIKKTFEGLPPEKKLKVALALQQG